MGARTKARPVAAGRVAARLALEFGLALSAFSFTLLASTVNVLTAVLALVGNLFYVVVYTRVLKRRAAEHRHRRRGRRGAAARRLCGRERQPDADRGRAVRDRLRLDAAPFLGARAADQENYAAAKVPMLPVVRGDDETARQILWYSVALVAVTLVPTLLGTLGLFYAAGALALGGYFIWLAWRLRRERPRPRAAFLFHYSLLYLALLFVVMAIDLVV